MVARRADSNPAATVPMQIPSASQPVAPNAPATNPQKLIDTKKLALIEKQINEFIGISNSEESSLSSGGNSNDSTLTAMILDDPPWIASPDLFIHTSDDFLAVHSDYSSRRSLLCCVANLQDKSFWALVDTGSCRNLMSEKFYQSLPLEVPLTPPGSTVVVAGNGKSLHLRGWRPSNLRSLEKLSSTK